LITNSKVLPTEPLTVKLLKAVNVLLSVCSIPLGFVNVTVFAPGVKAPEEVA
jgi:hypothetical protein